MEGLFIAKVLEEVKAGLPARAGGWVFPSETTSAVLLEGVGNLVLHYRPPTPALYLERGKLRGEPFNAFQRFLSARAKGTLTRAVQLKLDRVVMLEFSGESGFVDVPKLRLIFELTGRNANVIALEDAQSEALPDGSGWEGRIVTTAREVANTRNRFRTVRTGGLYTPPPPYDKLDPRHVSALELLSLSGTPLEKWHTRIDGLGPTLSLELAHRAGVGLKDKEFDPAKVMGALESLVRDPSLSAGTLSEQAREVSKGEKELSLRKALREPLEKRLNLLKNQIGDLDRAREGELAALEAREHADLLLAYQHQLPRGEGGRGLEGIGLESVDLPDFYSGEPIKIALDPSIGLFANAEKLYARARRREEVLRKLEERGPALETERARVRGLLETLESAGLEKLEALSRDLAEGREEKSAFGQRFRLSSGLELLVGRNDKENEYLTHRLGRSMDFWFHAQGYPGAHVLVRSGNRELSLEEILEAARIAAFNSKARGDLNVPVDYTRIKHVWKQRGAGAGKVHYTHQKTVFVDPVLPERVGG